MYGAVVDVCVVGAVRADLGAEVREDCAEVDKAVTVNWEPVRVALVVCSAVTWREHRLCLARLVSASNVHHQSQPLQERVNDGPPPGGTHPTASVSYRYVRVRVVVSPKYWLRLFSYRPLTPIARWVSFRRISGAETRARVSVPYEFVLARARCHGASGSRARSL